MYELVNMGQIIRPPSFELNVEPLDTLDVKVRSPPIVKLADYEHHAQLSATILFFISN